MDNGLNYFNFHGQVGWIIHPMGGGVSLFQDSEGGTIMKDVKEIVKKNRSEPRPLNEKFPKKIVS